MSGNEKTFRTKSGYCHIFPDHILLNRSGVAGSLSKALVGKNVLRILIIYGIMTLALAYLAYDYYQKGYSGTAIFFAVASFLVALNLLKSRKYSAEHKIPRDKIRQVTFQNATSGFTRSSFLIEFENEQEQIKKRLILLPGSLTGGAEETERALEIMREEFEMVEKEAPW